MNIDWSKSGYPSLHDERFRRVKRYSIVVTGVTGCLFLVGVAGAVLGSIPPLVAAISGALFILFGFIGSIGSIYATSRYVQIIPYFQRRLGGIDTFLAGHTLVRYLNQLDGIAMNQNVQPISSFGFADDLLGEEVVWHDPKIGLQTIGRIQAALNQLDIPNTIKRALLSDLAKWRQALERAVAEQVLFCVLLRHGNSTSAHEWEVRKGFAF